PAPRSPPPPRPLPSCFFFCTAPASPPISPLSLHDALPISLASPEAAEEEARTLHAAGRKRAIEGLKEKRPTLSLTAILTGILVLLAVLTLLTLWNLLGQAQPPAEPAPSSSEAESASSAVTVHYVPDFVGMSYAQIQNNRQYTGIYLFYVTEAYSDSAPAGTVL